MDLQRQLEELEALRSMYPEEEGCFILASAEQEAWAAAAATTAAPTAAACTVNLSGTVRLPGMWLEQQPVALRFQLPPGYPSVEPLLLSVECSASRHLHQQLSELVRDAAAAAVGSESLLLVLGALQDAVEAFSSAAGAGPDPGQDSGASEAAADLGSAARLPAEAAAAAARQPTGSAPALAAAVEQPAVSSSVQQCRTELLQAVVWFHHIKSTEKRKHLVAWARELNCTGYCKPGFPGIVVVEGLVADVREYLDRVRSLQWQAMQVRAEQTVRCAGCRAGGPTSGHCGEVVRALRARFTELPESGMSELGQACRVAGLEGLFLAALKLSK